MPFFYPGSAPGIVDQTSAVQPNIKTTSGHCLEFAGNLTVRCVGYPRPNLAYQTHARGFMSASFLID